MTMIARETGAARSATYPVPAPEGGSVQVPWHATDDDAHGPASPSGIREFYDRNGYVILRGLIPAALCQQARATFGQEIRPFRGYLYRQASANPERHQLTQHGFILNSLLNLQDLRKSQFPAFRHAALDVISASPLQQAVVSLLGEPGRVVQSMYFEGNPETWAHQDTYYLDSERLGAMAAAWIALEDIHPGAGRFYVYPGSHRIDMARNGGDFDIAFNHARYKQLVVDVIRKHRLQCTAPALAAGDVLFWSSRTIHGSLATVAPEHSRSSITAHFIPRSTRFMQYQTRARRLKLRTVNGLEVHCPKDQNRWLNRAILGLETRYPAPVRWLKQRGIKFLTG